MRKSLEQQFRAIDEVLTTMSQIAILDHALEYTARRPFADKESFEDDAAEHLDLLLTNIQTPDIDAELLDNIASSMVRNFGEVMAERHVQSLIGAQISGSRQNLVERLNNAEKILRFKRLRVIPHVSNIVYRGYPYASHEYTEKPNLLPIQAEEVLTIKTNLYASILPGKYQSPGAQRAYYGRYIGYSLGGTLLDRRDGKGVDHYISLVTVEGIPQATILPA